MNSFFASRMNESEADPGICAKGSCLLPFLPLTFLSFFLSSLPPLPAPPFPSLSPSPPLLSSALPLRSMALLNQLGSVWERCKFPQWGPDSAPAENEFGAL